MKDWRGKTVEVGSTVVYPVSHGASHILVEAKVMEVGFDSDNETRGWLRVERLHESEIVGWTKENRQVDFTPTRKPVDAKVVTLTSLDRVTVVEQ